MTNDMPVTGPFPIRINATASGCELDMSAFIISAVFTELITKADDDPEGLGELDQRSDLSRCPVSAAPAVVAARVVFASEIPLIGPVGADPGKAGFLPAIVQFGATKNAQRPFALAPG